MTAADKLQRAFRMLDEWVESKFKRVPRGRAGGGQFTFGTGKKSKAIANKPVRANKPATFKVAAAKKAWEGIHARRAAAKGAAPAAEPPVPKVEPPVKPVFVPPSWAKTGAAGTGTRFEHRMKARRQQARAAQLAAHQAEQAQREQALQQPARKVQTWRRNAALKAWKKIRANKEAAKVAAGLGIPGLKEAVAARMGRNVASLEKILQQAGVPVKPVPVKAVPGKPAAPAAKPPAAKPAAKHVHGKLDAQQREGIVRKHISDHDVKDQKHLNGGVNKFDIIVFDDGHLGGFKPAAGENPVDGWKVWVKVAMAGHVADKGFIDEIMAIPEAERDAKFGKRDRLRIPYGMQTEREVAAWEVAKLVGMDDLAAPCVDGNIAGQRGAAMELHPGEDAYKVNRGKQFDGDENVRRVAMFDYILGNGDRHGGNWRIDEKAGADKILMIDHGLVLPEAADFADMANMEIMKHAARLERRNPGKVESPQKYVKLYADKKNEIRDALVKLKFNQKVIDGAMVRIDRAQHVKKWDDLNAFAKQPAKANAAKAAAPPPNPGQAFLQRAQAAQAKKKAAAPAAAAPRPPGMFTQMQAQKKAVKPVPVGPTAAMQQRQQRKAAAVPGMKPAAPL